jgi:hypothetical protein
LKDVLQEDEDYIECPNQFCVCAWKEMCNGKNY